MFILSTSLFVYIYHPEVRPEGREPLADREGESTLLSQSGEEKGLR